MSGLEPHEYAKLAAWARRAHAQSKHCIVFVDGYDPEAICAGLAAALDVTAVSAVDLEVDGWWVSVRRILPVMPTSILRNPSVAVCTITP